MPVKESITGSSGDGTNKGIGVLIGAIILALFLFGFSLSVFFTKHQLGKAVANFVVYWGSEDGQKLYWILLQISSFHALFHLQETPYQALNFHSYISSFSFVKAFCRVSFLAISSEFLAYFSASHDP